MTVIDPFTRDALLDPHPIFAELRSDAPVRHHPSLDVWTVARHADVTAVLRAAKTFSSALGMGELMAGRLDPRQPEMPRMTEMMGPLRIVIATDPPDHTKRRRLISAPFGAREVVYLEPRIQMLCDELVDGLLRSDAPDLITDVAVPLPVIVIAELLGIPTERRGDFKRWSNDMVGGLSGDLDLTTRQQSAFEMFEFFSQAITERQREPGEDVISRLVGRADDLGPEDQLTAPDLVAFCILLLIAGNETTTNLIANAAQAFFAHPGEWDRLHRDPSLAGGAVEEALRYDGPVKALLRMPAEDTSIGGVDIPAGARVMPLFSSANRDEAVFAEPDRFDITRHPEEHIAFGYGIHHCLGAPLARLETRVLLETMARRIRTIEPSGPGEPVESIILRGWQSVPVAVGAA
jgi:cytochrome P450